MNRIKKIFILNIFVYCWGVISAFFAKNDNYLKSFANISSLAKKLKSGGMETFYFIAVSVPLAISLSILLQNANQEGILSGSTYDPHSSADAGDLLANVREITGEIRSGESLAASLKANGVNEEASQSFVDALDGLVNFRGMRPNDRYSLTLDDEGNLLKCQYESGPLGIHVAERDINGSFKAKQLNVSLDRRTVKIRGKIESSLFSALSAQKEDPKLIYSFADIFASKIDFNTETRYGDTFELVFEKYFKNDQFIGYGKILLARYDSKEVGKLEGFYFDNGSDMPAYFDEHGQELGASFIRSPLPMAKVSSGFSYKRRHPVLDIVRPHLGIDLAAPSGTPVMAVADGRVTFAGWKGGYGKLVVIDHHNGYQTYYAHLSRFSEKLKEGAKIKQKQNIGYVGTTGIATGPHLDYRMAKNGSFLNPFSAKFIPRSKLSGSKLVIFAQEAQKLAGLARSLNDPKVMVVKNVVVTPENPLNLL